MKSFVLENHALDIIKWDVRDEMKTIDDFKIGDNIIYIPTHANGNRKHPDCEHGYVTGKGKTTVFCKFYDKHGRLRTVANSEGCDPSDLLKC